jgi:hypothetical protein
MQPKFTRKNLWVFCTKIFALALVFGLMSQLSFAQITQKKPASTVGDPNVKLRMLAQRATSPNADNDAGLANRKSVVLVQRPDAICQTFNGDFAGAPTMVNRLFRPGNTSSCTVPYAFPGTFAQTVPYRTFTYTNSTGLTQCGTFTLSTVGGTSNAQFAIYAGSFDPTNLATNYLADPGVSGVGAPTSCQGTIASGATIVFAVFDLGTPATSFSLTVDFPICSSAPCAGTPNPGNTVSSTNPVCPSINFTLSAQNATTGSGVTYQWQSGPALAGPFTDIAGATAATYTTSITTNTAYRVKVTCSAGPSTGTSNAVLETLNAPANCYCTPVYTNGCTLGDYIARVRLGTLDNSSTCSTPPFTYYNAVGAPTLVAGLTYQLIVTVGPDTFGQNVGAWIDYNQNGIFEPSEFLATPINAGPSGTATLTFTIPGNATTGSTRIRVRGGDDVAMTSGQACGATNSTFGEAEDYNVNITPCIQGAFTTQPSNASTQCSGNATFGAAATGTAVTYSWEYRVNASSPWQVVNNGGVYSGAATNTLILRDVPGTMSGYQYRAVIQGPCTATDVSNPATLTVSPLVATVSPTTATI